MNKKGRKPKCYPTELIEKIIFQFSEDKNIRGKIGYSEVYRYSMDLYEKKLIDVKFSEDFWRRSGKQGKETIDEINKIYEESIVSEKKEYENISLIDTVTCVESLFEGSNRNKRQLISQLKINEKVAKKSITLNQEMAKLKSSIDEKQKELDRLKQANAQYEKILFSWFRASRRTDIPLINLMNFNEEAHPIMDLFIKEVFNNTTNTYDKFKEFYPKESETKKSNSRLAKLIDQRKNREE